MCGSDDGDGATSNAYVAQQLVRAPMRWAASRRRLWSRSKFALFEFSVSGALTRSG